jgi:hypothetical protein
MHSVNKNVCSSLISKLLCEGPYNQWCKDKLIKYNIVEENRVNHSDAYKAKTGLTIQNRPSVTDLRLGYLYVESWK